MSNFKLSNVPAPVREAAWNAEIIKCPAFDVFGVIDIEALSVPT